MDEKELSYVYSRLVETAEAKGFFVHPRDGRILKLVPKSEKLSFPDFSEHLLRLFMQKSHIFTEACSTFQQTMSTSSGETKVTSRHRCYLAWIRSLTYLQAGNATQALKDAKVAMSFSLATHPSADTDYGLQSSATTRNVVMAAVKCLGDTGLTWVPCSWSAALEAAATAHEAVGQHSAAAVYMKRALESLSFDISSSSTLDKQHVITLTVDEPDAMTLTRIQGNIGSRSTLQSLQLDAYSAALLRIMQYLSQAQQQALQGCNGAQGLWTCLEEEYEESLPEIRRSRPKYYYYERWMKRRVEQLLPGLPPCVAETMVKRLDADDLDLLLVHPAGLMAQATEMLHVLTHHGEDHLVQCYKPNRLCWEEVQALTGPHLVGLPLGYEYYEPARKQHPPSELTLSSSSAPSRQILPVRQPCIAVMDSKQHVEEVYKKAMLDAVAVQMKPPHTFPDVQPHDDDRVGGCGWAAGQHPQLPAATAVAASREPHNNDALPSAYSRAHIIKNIILNKVLSDI
ncbi:hypothetical protein CEUSTIGMA_g13515.t1 [Chlamydomonas eustigma]|uniref:Uncharacterized protein n=1 Tax=Chlamydomonas eustigma TaxID=1157962 RepID=A0A250XT54_9CHLO|nr:hypothetical protein CEUSTIGMA_g13515.t1 [Chlamydomonas eustigma]|eukprot:GAX86102.1 hypothetical protein CEUSTIGMA_g13515.t1 [Chlamydomonas eustigma]